ncbi:MAG: dTDP-4-dehydrorhamnose 35-epimerase related [Acidimicrobiales bacterium]|nr:dTDP-4-dehydrorhamnose 35-epimerase related [Acidimicrobiales bacterium]
MSAELGETLGMAEILPFSATESTIAGLWHLTMKQITDERGVVREFYRESAFADAGLPSLGPWLQVNVTETRQGAVRGLHGEAMHKLVAIAHGAAFGAYVDVRAESPTFGNVVTRMLTAGEQILVPPGVCNGFQSVSEGVTQYLYCFDQEWTVGMAGTAVHALDAALAIEWPLPVDVDDPAVLSVKDASLPPFPG